MFPHNSSSHEISTETNAFVQNSKGDVVVLEESSLSGAREGERPEHARYCDIEFINSSMMAAPTSHPKATAANDFLTVLPRQSGELSFADGGEACQSVAPETTKNPTNHLLTYDNNDKINNHNNAEHNHHKYRKQNTPGSLGKLGSSADNSKSTCKLLSDNKDSFSVISIRVLMLSVRLNDTIGVDCCTAGVPSLVRIPKSDCPQRLLYRANLVDNYSLLGSRLHHGENNNVKANIRMISNNNSKSVILLSSKSYGDYYNLDVTGDAFVGINAVGIPVILVNNDTINGNRLNRVNTIGNISSVVTSNMIGGIKDIGLYNSKIVNQTSNVQDCNQSICNMMKYASQLSHDFNDNGNKSVLLYRAHKLTAMNNASSSITLIVSKNEFTDHVIDNLQSLIDDDNLTQVRALSPVTSQYYQQLLSHVTVNKLTQRICVPLLIKSKGYDKNNNVANNSDYCNIIDDTEGSDEMIFHRVNHNIYCDKVDDNTTMNVNGNNNPDVIDDIVNVAVCYKTSCIMTTNVSMLGSQNDGISRTEATIFTVGALSFQDNDKSNKPLNDSYKINKYQVSTKIGLESNSNIKSVSKFMLSVKYSDKSETSHQARHDVSDVQRVKRVRSSVNIPTLTTCEPTMTLKSQSATVTSQTETVPVISRVVIENISKCVSPTIFTTQNQSINSSNNFNEQISNIEMNSTIYNEQVNEYINERDNADARPLTRNWARLIAYVRALIPACHEAYKNNESNCESQRNELKKVLHSLFGDSTIKHTQSDPINDYKKRWGIPIILSLAGGGESSLNTGGGTNWGSAQATTPNNNNPNSSGWGATPGNVPPPSSNWGTTNVNRPVTGNPNQNQNQGPPGNQTNSSAVNKANNPNVAANSQTGPPTSQPANPTQQNPNGPWPQGKPNNSVGPGSNQSASNNNGNNVQQTPPSGGPPGTNANNNQSNSPQSSAASTNSSSGTTPPTMAPNPSTKLQLEQLNTMREALFSQDGWGCQHVNQDTNWDVPASPEPIMNKDGVPMWKPPVNNGTDLWEANLRNGGQPPPPQQAKTPWGHTPSTNIGGTWGEDDETADSSNMWTGAPTPTQPNTPQWAGATGNQTASNWGDPRIDPRDPRDIRSVDPREMRDPRDHRMSMDPREHLRPMDPMARDPRMADMRGDIRGGVSGRLNGASADAMWGQPPGPPHHQMGHQHPSGPPAKMLNASSMNQWAAPPPKEMMPGKPSGWEEPSPPAQRRNVPNYDDGTSLWGNPAANQRPMTGSKVSHWKDIPSQNLGRGGMQCPPGMPQNRMPGQPMKPDVGGPMWGHPGAPGGRNGSWGEGPHETTNWDEPKTPASWNEPPLNPASWGGPPGHKSKAMVPTGSWGEADMEPPSWGHPSKPALTKEFIWNSREFRYLCDLGYKKEDVETALRKRDMNRDEALELLQLRSLDWRRHDAPSGYDPTNPSSMSSAYPKFSHVAQQMSFPQGECLGVRPSGAASGSVSGSVASASLLKLQQQQQQQAAVQMQPPPQQNTNPPQPPFNQASKTPQNPPSAQQLRMLVQQIQLAVQEGYLNQQILNQPLAPHTLILLNQLLQQIKILQQLLQHHSLQSSVKINSQTVLQISVQITKTKQQIANLQNQIAVQQATYMKQQAQQQQQHPIPSQSSDYYKTSVHDPMSAIQNSFSDLTMNKEPPVCQQQSRLNQWKLPSIDKDVDITGNEFSRAPGTTSKPPQAPGGLSHTHSSPNMNPLLGQADGTWSTRLGDSGWPDAGNNDATDGKDWQPGSAAFTDLVPEFEPGKPWKMKNIEDDPSITPGSVVRSLSLAAIKDPDTIFSSSSKTSPPPQSQNVDTSIPSLSNSTWSFNPPATTPSAFSSSKNTWTDSAPPPTAVTSELWGAPMNKARQGPPPGLSSKGVGNTSNGWAGLGGVSRPSSSWGLQSGGGGAGGGGGGSNAGWLVGGTWLLLKNLTPQIDGSTLKTLCMQHGPVQDFRLYLNHGIALTKYSSRDESSKAQGALNNCVLGNTTIFAESPADSEVHTLLQQLSHGGQQQTSSSGGSGWGLRPSNKAGPPPDTWGGSSSQLWGAPPTTNSLWSNSGIDSGEAQRTTPSSLNSYLPGDLLGGESM
ncbi:trinucleotide repeat-containing gene 6C protein isoform X2 [Diachasmimorpha longicaudata]|uniref:trinucleotide repeat-containing gene 6C protein isoform X2 n=1 Tax=Diachasmimorpha longicaudata TaxID=58733 RepID=UPI0030B8B800